MRNLTPKEKQILLDAMKHYIDATEYLKSLLSIDDSDKLTQRLSRIRNLYEKLKLDFYPIVIGSNNVLMDCECSLCGNIFTPDVPEWGFLNSGQFDPICERCFKKYAPKEFKKLCRINEINNEKYSKI